MEVHTKTYQTPNGMVEGVQTKWAGFNILLVTGLAKMKTAVNKALGAS